MTIPQLANRLCSRWLTVQTPSEMPAAHQQTFLDAMHAGCGEYFSLVPMRFRSKEFGVRYGVPVTGTAAVTAGSKTVTAMSVVPVDGATVVLAGDTVRNRVAANPSGSGYLLEIPFGGSTGTVAATVSRDVALIPWDIAGFITPPRDARENYRQFMEIPHGTLIHDWPSDVQAYRVEQAGANTLLRMIPDPAADLAVTMTVEIANVAITGIASVTTGTLPLPLPDDHAIRMVAPLCGERLISHPLFRDSKLAAAATKDADRARADIALLRPRASAGFNRILAPCP